jgi:GAF domain-containing protein
VSSSAAIQDAEVARLIRERDEVLEQQTATSEVLQVISTSTGHLEPVFDKMLENAARICGAKFGNIYRWDADGLHLAATYNTPPAFAEARRRSPFRPDPKAPFARMLASKTVVQVADVAAEQAYIERNPAIVAAVELGGARTAVLVPMLKENELIGAIALFRQEVCLFTDKQIALVQNFAAQAVIAIENARLLNELRQRTTDLTEALEQQTATSEVLQVISSSPGELEPVFATMLANAVRICDAKFGNIFRWDGDVLRLIATHNTPPAFAEVRRRLPLRTSPENLIGRMVATKMVVHVADLAVEQAYIDQRSPQYVAAVELGGVRTFLAVPMLNENELIGAFILYREEVRPFADKQIALVTSFAAQAVIAIENTRLLNELRQRTADLTEALEQQTATSEVLQVISSSPGDLEPVLDKMLENAVRICDAKFGDVYRWEGDVLRLLATHKTPPALVEELRRFQYLRPSAVGPGRRMAATKSVVHLADLAEQQGYIERTNPVFVAAVELGGARTLLLVPMLKESELIGAFVLVRQEVRPFTDKQIELVRNFAAQAVIAIENTRLLNELRQRTTDLTEALEQQMATSEVLRVVGSSPADLQPVFEAMLENAVRICDARAGGICRWDGHALHHVAVKSLEPAFADLLRRTPIHPNPKTNFGRMLVTKKAVHVPDLAAQPAYIEQREPGIVAAVEIGRLRTVLYVPMLRESELVGAITLGSGDARPFTDKQIELIENFAAQAVIAIENLRLLNELRERTNQLQVQSQELAKLNQELEQRVTDQVGEIERMGRLRRFLPPQVADLIVASGTEKQLESHRREITALFCDLRGFTGFSESSDPEDVMALLRDYHAAIGETIIKYSGTLERYAGDGVMVVFNDPVAVEKPALQAVLMALEMRDVIGALTEKWRRLGHDIGFGIGIAHGFATLGTIGFEGRFDYAAIGTVSNVASRLCDEAKPGQILISPRVFMAVEDAVSVEPVGEFTLKGIRRPLAAYNVLAAASSNP